MDNDTLESLFVTSQFLALQEMEKKMARPSKVNQKKQAKNQSRKNEGGKKQNKQKKQKPQKQPQGSN